MWEDKNIIFGLGKKITTMELFSERVMALSPSATFAMSQKAADLKATGLDVISLSVGEPDFNTPDHIKAAAKQAIDDNWSRYSPVPGYPALREAICAKLKNENGLDYAPSQIVVSNGAKQSITNAILALVNPGDEGIIPAPYWVSYPEMVKMADGTPVIVHAGIGQDFKITGEQLEKHISDKTKALILCSPSNPTGSVYSKDELKALATILARHPQVYVIADEIYEHINYVGRHESIAQFESIRARVIIINGVSKAYAMTGWRVGWALGPKEIISKINSLQGHLTSNACAVAQWAALGALQGAEEDVEKMRLAFAERRETIMKLISDMPYLKITEPDGAFYAFVNIKDCPVPDDMEFCARLLEEKYIAAVPGTAFFAPGYIRISYASSMENIVEGMKRLKEFLESL